MGLQAIINVGYAHTIKDKFINCSWTVVSSMAAVGKGPHFLQKNLPAEFSGYGPGQPSLTSHTEITRTLLQLCEVVTRLWQFMQGVCNLAEL